MRLSLPSISKLAVSAAVLACLCTSGTVSHAQDQQFTQFNAAPTAFNPAYAGVSGKARLASLYRTQWTGLPQAFTGFHLAYDRPTLDKRMGFGFLLSNEQAGAGQLALARPPPSLTNGGLGFGTARGVQGGRGSFAA